MAQDSAPWVVLRISFRDLNVFLWARKPRAAKYFFAPVRHVPCGAVSAETRLGDRVSWGSEAPFLLVTCLSGPSPVQSPYAPDWVPLLYGEGLCLDQGCGQRLDSAPAQLSEGCTRLRLLGENLVFTFKGI